MDELLSAYRTRSQALADASPELASLVPSLGPGVLAPTAIAALQDRLPFRLPASFLEYLRGPLVESGLEWAEITIPSNDDLEQFEKLMLRPELWRLNLLQFGTGRCGDDICFDYLEEPAEPGVLEINHDRAPAHAWDDARLIRSFADRRWSSFKALVEDLCGDEL